MNYSTSPRFLLTAAWILPVAAPAIMGGGIVVNAGKIESLLNAEEVLSLRTSEPQLPEQHLARAALTPGLINLHTHLDYTNLAHLEAFKSDETMFDWLEELVSQSRSQLNTAEILARSALAGAGQAALAGTSYVVDSTFSGAAALGLAQVGLKGLVGLELFGLDSERAPMLFKLWQERLAQLIATAGSALSEAIERGGLRLTVAPHAPYTVSPSLWSMARDWAKERGLPLTCHLAESVNEYNWVKDDDDRLNQYLLKVMPKNGDDKQAAAQLKALPWRGLGRSPCQHLEHHQLLDEGTIAAHCRQIGPDDIKILAQRKVKIALCPRSNMGLHNGLPLPQPLSASGITVGLGTDSLASSPSLSLLEEGRYLRRMLRDAAPCPSGQAPDYQQLLQMLTLDGARAVGLAHQIGSLEPGKAADIAAFDLSVPEYIESDADQPANGEEVLEAIFERSRGCLLLLVDGKAIVRDGQLI